MSRTTTLSEGQIKEAHGMYISGLSLEETSSKFGVSRQVLSNNFSNMKLKIRPKGPITINKKGYAIHGLFWPEKLLTSVRKFHSKINKDKDKKKPINKLVPELILEGLDIYDENKITKHYSVSPIKSIVRKRINAFLPTSLDEKINELLITETYEKNGSFEYYKISDFCMVLINMAMKARSEKSKSIVKKVSKR